MRLDVSQHLKLVQQMKLSPRIIQAMEILQLPMIALQERIEQEMQSNPVLEMRIAGSEFDAASDGAAQEAGEDRDERPMVVNDSNDNSEDFRRLAQMEEDYGPELISDDAPMRYSRSSAGAGERDRKLDAMANTPAPEMSLDEYLQQQWSFIEAPPAVERTGLEIISNIEEDGYLRPPLEDVLKACQPPVSAGEMAEALKLVQTLEPVGVGARPEECLLIQLYAEGAAGRDVSLETELVSNFLRDIEQNRLPHISRRIGKPVEQIKAALENLGRLNLRPGLAVGQRAAPAINPDGVVELDDEGNIVITMPDGNMPRMYISKDYRRMVHDRQTDRNARVFIRNNIRSAEWLMGAIEQRRRTVRRVIEEVFKVQRDFLERGREALRPLPMADVARKVGVHVATVSRAVAGKYVQTPQGIFPLRMFFSGGTTNSDGQDVAWDAVKAKLREIVDAEDKSNPLNDDELAAELNKHGLDIARRTVAKYRGLLDIQPARKRRRY